MTHFNVNLISDTFDITTTTTGKVFDILTNLTAFLTELELKETYLADIGVNSDFEMSDEIVDQLDFCANAIQILTNRMKQINWIPLEERERPESA